jgi:hypothetical protein
LDGSNLYEPVKHCANDPICPADVSLDLHVRLLVAHHIESSVDLLDQEGRRPTDPALITVADGDDLPAAVETVQQCAIRLIECVPDRLRLWRDERHLSVSPVLSCGELD